MKQLKAKDIMTANPRMIGPFQTVKEAAILMKNIDCGALPVGELGHVAGIITDRDIVLRVIATGGDPDSIHVRDVMTKKHYSCTEEDNLETVAEKMRAHNIRRLLVSKNNAISGIISSDCLLRKPHDKKVSECLLHKLIDETSRAA
jgi:CBS domain-containing protein